MIFTETFLPGAFLIDIRQLSDERGFFARSFCRREFLENGLNPDLAQCDISFNRFKGTLRGMHYQVPPYAEDKLVRCTRGAIYDVMIDLRPNSPAFLKWAAFEINAESYRMLFIPKGFAHGFITLAENTEVFYQISEFYSPECSRGVRWNDPLFNIEWPAPVECISRKDQEYPDSVPEDFTPFSSPGLHS